MFFLTLALILFSLCAIIYHYFQRSYEYWAKKNVPFLKPSFPFGNYNKNFLSDNAIIIKDIHKELRETGARYGGYYLLSMPVFIPLTPEICKEVLVKSFNSFHDHISTSGADFDDPMGAVLVILTGSKWKYIRSKLSPAFSAAKLKNMFPIINNCSTEISEYVHKSRKLDIHDLATRYATDVICSCAFGIEANSLKEKNADFIKYGRKLVHMNIKDTIRLLLMMNYTKTIKYFRMKMFNPEVTNFFYQIVKETIEYREKNNIRRSDFMDSLIRLKNNENIDEDNPDNKNNDGEGLSVQEIAAQVFFFYWAGFETSSTCLSCCLYLLAKNPEIQDKLRDEILNILQENNGELTYESIMKMTYADKVLQETMRMYPPILMINRICTEDFKLPKSMIVIEKGTRVAISILGIHHDPQYYPNPHIFDPERFSEAEKAKRPPMTYFPFGDGPRICLGYKFAMIELKIALVQFLRNTRYTVHPSVKPEVEIRSYVNLLGFKEKIYLVPEKI